MSQICIICGTLTGCHGFSFDRRVKELEAQRLQEDPAAMRVVINKFIAGPIEESLADNLEEDGPWLG